MDIMDFIIKEYEDAKQNKALNISFGYPSVECRTVRIFISSTFRDFHNERDVLVTRVFPRLRDWCNQQYLYLVECDLRWGIPTDVSKEETLITCLDEIERGRTEMNDMNFFLGLIGERYGWVPDEDDLTEFVKNRYKWIEGSSVTLMEIVHGMIRSLTPNGLILCRNSAFVSELAESKKADFIETDPKLSKKLSLFKEFLKKQFTIQDYSVKYEGIKYNSFIGQDYVVLSGFENFELIIEQHIKKCIVRNLLKEREKTEYHRSIISDRVGCDKNELELYHEFTVNNLVQNCSIDCCTVTELVNKIKMFTSSSNIINKNPLILLSGPSGAGKSTVMAKSAGILRKDDKFSVFFHSISCTSTSKFKQSLIDRLYLFFYPESAEEINAMTLSEKISKILKVLKWGKENDDIDKYYVLLLDGVDEICKFQHLEWISISTNINIITVMSCTLDDSVNSIYYQLKNRKNYWEEIVIKPFPIEHIECFVNDYLRSFGKALDKIQLETLLKQNASTNPLWLLLACEELRIHGDYNTILKLIKSFPPTLLELKLKIITRLLSNDDQGYLKLFLFLLLESRAGVWESLGKELIGNLCKKKINSNKNYYFSDDRKISHRDWMDLVRQMKGFLHIFSYPLPLIKFRHKSFQECIRNYLDFDEKTVLNYHTKLSSFYKTLISNNVYLHDYVFHLIKAKQTDEFLKFLRNKNSWKIFSNTHVRKQLVNCFRCQFRLNKITATSKRISICLFCADRKGDFSIYNINKNACYICGSATINVSNTNAGTKSHYLFKCIQHSLSGVDKCVVCYRLLAFNLQVPVKLCASCQLGQHNNDICGVLVQQNDIHFSQMQHFTYQISNLFKFI